MKKYANISHFFVEKIHSLICRKNKISLYVANAGFFLKIFLQINRPGSNFFFFILCIKSL